MKDKDIVLSINCGTQSLKAILFDVAGNVLDLENISFVPYFSKYPGWAEQDPDLYWNALCQSCQALWSRGKVTLNRLAGISLTTQRGTIVNIDKYGNPVRPAIIWLDQRKTAGLKPIGGLWSILFKMYGVSDTISFFQQEAEANWIRTNQPDIWRQTYKYLLLSGYLTYRLTNEFNDSTGCQVGYLPFDYRRQTWSSAWDWKWQGSPVRRKMLPELFKPGEIIGYISPKASEETGIPKGLPMIASAADKACQIIGSGSLESSTGFLSYGTTATINVTSSKYFEAIRMIPPFPSAVPKHYSLEVMIYRGYWLVDWFKHQFGNKEIKKAQKMGINDDLLFDKLFESVSPGAMGLMLQPYWSPGIKIPGPEAKGSIIGFGEIHSRKHLYRAILEGISYALREGQERIEKCTNIPIKTLRIIGGSQSNNFMQLTANMFNLPAARPHLSETAGLGAAINCVVGLGLHPDYKSAIAAMTHTGEIFEPEPDAFGIYDQLYTRVYKKIYKQLRPLYQQIREITGYPKA